MAALTDVNALTSIAIMLETTAPKPKLNKFTENLRREMPIVLEQEKEGIIAACGEVAYNACKTSADLAAKSTPKETSEGLTTPAKETLIARSKTLSIKDYFDILAEAPTVTHKNIINIVTQNKEKIANAVDLISAKAPNNQVVKLLQNFGINGNDLVYFAEAVCNPAGLKAIGRYVDKPTIPNLARIFIDTNTLSFGIKHLMISYGNYFKELSKGSEVTTTPKTATAPKKRTWEEKINQDSKKTRHISLDKSV